MDLQSIGMALGALSVAANPITNTSILCRLGTLDVLTVHLQVVHQYLEQMVVTVSDPTLLQSEVGVGSDVAQAQLTEAVP